MINPYIIHLLIMICIFIILSTSLNLAMGFTGLMNLSHVAFFGIGAYTSALLTFAGIPFWAAFISAGLVAALFGFLLSIPTARLKGDYLALATLGFAFITHSILLNWTWLTRGPLGLPGIYKPFINNTEYLIFAAIVALISIFIIWRITRSQFGKMLEAVRDDEISASVIGKNIFKAKAIAMAVSAFFAGIAGSLFAHYITFIDPSSFLLSELVLVLTIVIIGGLASNRGVILAAIIIILLPEPLRFLSLPSSLVGPLRQLIYALILLFIILYRPKGFFGKVEL
ncbi:MAG: branched-chain amino acid ABC transporter permease [Candidatus Woesearchaeota archaeon]